MHRWWTYNAVILFLFLSVALASLNPAQAQQSDIIPRGLPDTLQNRIVAAEQYYDSLEMHSLVIESGLQHPGINTERQRDAVRRIFNIEAKQLRNLIVDVMVEHYTVDEIYADLAYRKTQHGSAMLRKVGSFTASMNKRMEEFGSMLKRKYGKN